MAKRKIRIGVLFGGKSAEHEVSVQSARNVVAALNKHKYNVTPIAIDKNGVGLPSSFSKFDVIFPVLHGPYGEDGSIQGLLKLSGVPFVGAGVLGSAIGMDKDVMKRLLREAGLPVAPFLVFHEHDKKSISFEKIKQKLGLPFFIKPANLGSSVGVSKVHAQKEFKRASELAFSYDRKIIIEKYIQGREIECAILGNGEPTASVCGEIILHHEFYSYEAKYLDEHGATLSIPANIGKKLEQKIQKLAIEAFKTLCCEGMARVDFFLSAKGQVYVNEINTIPGFTAISMYPKLWEASGVSYSNLVDTLAKLAIESFEKEQKLNTSK